jgi:hypothetical protein
VSWRYVGCNAELISVHRLYEAKAGMAPGNDAGDIKDTPLVRWKEAGPHPEGRNNDNCEVYGPNRVPSNGDYGFVRNVYPWKGS